jgi:hypothetical protein
VVSADVLRLGNPGAEDVLLADLRDAFRRWLDQQFVDPAVVAVPGESPGSITDGVSAIPSAGSTPFDATADLRRLLGNFVAGGGHVESAVLVMSSANERPELFWDADNHESSCARCNAVARAEHDRGQR